ncbi:GerAB/ArcD/ProY family transporter [Pseudalkalibacillus sp. R45]|uniref:GerAB/ArcD/ProY family transporter n=1 Tax=Pseudalkalibacillus sp. R45 TaxID=3457433 RepID=UPI003FCD55CF
MIEKGKISVAQFALLIFMVTVGDSILVLPGSVAVEAKQDSWISGIFAMIVGMGLVMLFYQVSKLFPNQTFVEYSEILFGKFLGRIIALFFIFYPFLSVALLLRELGDFLTTQILPNTPIEAITTLFIVFVIYGSRLGLENWIRTVQILFPYFIFLAVLFFIFLFPLFNFENIQPVLGDGIKPMLRGSLTFIAFPYMETLIVLLMFFPYVNIKKSKELRNAMFISQFSGGLLLMLLMLCSVLVFGGELVAHQQYPTYALAKKISIGEFLERIEAIIAILWLITIFIKSTYYFYASALGLAQLFKLKDYRPLTFPMGLVLIVLSLSVSPSLVYYNEAIGQYWPMYDFSISLLFIPLILILGWLKKRKSKGTR